MAPLAIIARATMVSSSDTFRGQVAIRGHATYTSSNVNYGGFFNAAAIYGRGVHGAATGTNGKGVFGEATNTGNEINYGGYFKAAGE